MSQNSQSLKDVFDGWDGFQSSLVQAITPLTPAQLSWRPAATLNSVGELARHISFGRITWFSRMDVPGSERLTAKISEWETDRDGNQHIIEAAIPIADKPAELVMWLEDSWQMIARTLGQWSVADLSKSYQYTWNGTAYANSRQWTLWRVLTHDVYHGGQLSLMLGMQGINHFELGDLFGHLTTPPLAPAEASETDN